MTSGDWDFWLGFFFVCFFWGGRVGACLVVSLLVYEETGWKTQKENVDMRLNSSPVEGENKDKASQEKETNGGMWTSMLLVQVQFLL